MPPEVVRAHKDFSILVLGYTSDNPKNRKSSKDRERELAHGEGFTATGTNGYNITRGLT